MSAPQYTRSVGRHDTVHHRNYRTLEELLSGDVLGHVNGIMARLANPKLVAKADDLEKQAYQYRLASLILCLPKDKVTEEMRDVVESLRFYTFAEMDSKHQIIQDYQVAFDGIACGLIDNETHEHFDRAEAALGSHRHQRWLRLEALKAPSALGKVRDINLDGWASRFGASKGQQD